MLLVIALTTSTSYFNKLVQSGTKKSFVDAGPFPNALNLGLAGKKAKRGLGGEKSSRETSCCKNSQSAGPQLGSGAGFGRVRESRKKDGA